jgi:hypothetical protein
MAEKKEKAIAQNRQLKQQIKIAPPKHLQEQEGLFAKADAISPASKKIDESEIVKLRGGEEINLAQYISENYAEAATHFYKPFYQALAQLFSVDPIVMERYRKPHFVPVFKNSFIYARFPQRVIERIHEKNPYVGYCKRKYKNYQCLTIAADEQLREYIMQVQTIIEMSDNVKDFIILYCTKYNLPIQLNLFENLIAK